MLKITTSFTPLPWALGRPAPALGAPGARPWGASTPPHASVRQWGALPGKLTRALESRRPKPIPSPALFSPAAADPRGGPDQRGRIQRGRIQRGRIQRGRIQRGRIQRGRIQRGR